MGKTRKGLQFGSALRQRGAFESKLRSDAHGAEHRRLYPSLPNLRRCSAIKRSSVAKKFRLIGVISAADGSR
jgi:hypothetical protein